MFSIDYDILIRFFLLSDLQKDRAITMLKCFITPIKVLYNELNQYRFETLKRLEYTGQVIYLEKLLNDTYISEDAVYLIYIEDIADIEYTYLFDPNEPGEEPLYLYDPDEYIADPTLPMVYLFDEDELILGYNFIIKVPLAVYNSLGMSGIERMIALVNNYRLAGKNFIIQSY